MIPNLLAWTLHNTVSDFKSEYFIHQIFCHKLFLLVDFLPVLKGLDKELSNASFISLNTAFTEMNDESCDGNFQPLGNNIFN